MLVDGCCFGIVLVRCFDCNRLRDVNTSSLGDVVWFISTTSGAAALWTFYALA